MLEVDIKKQLNAFTLDVSFRAEQEVLGLLGMSGSGKSMTLKCIAGVHKPDSGRIVLNGRVLFDSEQGINLSPQERNIGFLFQDYALFPNMTVWDNVAVGLKAKQERKEQIKYILNEMRLTDKAALYPRQISGGEKQRLALARIIVNKPEIMLLDEPFSALDEFLSWKIALTLHEVLQTYVDTAVLVTHDMSEVYRMTDSVCLLHEGHSEPKIPTTELFTRPSSYAACVLTGVKNFVAFEQTAADTIHVPDYNLELRVSQKQELLPSGILAILPEQILLQTVPYEEEDNVFICRICDCIKNLHNTIYFLEQRDKKQNKYLIVEQANTQVRSYHKQDIVYLKLPVSALLLLPEDQKVLADELLA